MSDSFEPVFQITPTINKALMSIEADRLAITQLPITPGLLNLSRATPKAENAQEHGFDGRGFV